MAAFPEPKFAKMAYQAPAITKAKHEHRLQFAKTDVKSQPSSIVQVGMMAERPESQSEDTIILNSLGRTLNPAVKGRDVFDSNNREEACSARHSASCWID